VSSNQRFKDEQTFVAGAISRTHRVEYWPRGLICQDRVAVSEATEAMERNIHNEQNIDRPLRGARVLVVEDDALVLMELESILQDAGAETVACCRNVKDGLAAVEQKPPAAAILDVNIGRRAIAPVARRLAHCGTPFLFYTGEMENESALAEWPGHLVLTKPERPATIVAAVAHLLEHAGVEQD
jgi:CheY-like chemotaxis protein